MHLDVKHHHKTISQCLIADQHKLRNRLRKLSRQQTTTTEKALQNLLADIEQSREKVSFRRAHLPKPNYPDNLPVVDARADILAAIDKHPVTIICGETGSGKTTQLPKMCLELERGTHGMIGHTQPRRIAARSVASRIASELNDDLGSSVGYKVRFADKLSPQTYIKLMTDGILLAEIQSDPYLNQYDTLIIDEAHERSLNIDFLLGYLKQLLPKRPDLKLIITSATIDPERFSRHFNHAPIIRAEGRSYPVTMHYRPPAERPESDRENDLQSAIVEACEDLAAEGPGDILVFLPGERQIHETADALGKQITHSPRLRGTLLLPLFARLSHAEQQRIFTPQTQRRIVLATNVAETSLTVPGIRYVVDSGLARISRYSLRSKVQRLPVERISQASANQRAGRCGREAPGICIRLYAEEDHLAQAQFTEPEILRTNLASVILQMEAMRIGHIEDFPFVETPDPRLITDGYRLLHELNAVNEQRTLSKTGRLMAKLPIDPRFARMLIEADREGCLDDVLTIVSGLSVQDPRERPIEFRQAADERHREFQHEQSDFISYINLWAFYTVQSKRLSKNQLRKMCRERFLSHLRLREWSDVRQQLLSQLKTLGYRLNEKSATPDNIHRALLAGLLSNVAVKNQAHEYLGTRNRKLHIFPGSSLFKMAPKWFVAGEVIETTRLYAHQIAKIQPEWIEKLAGHLLTRSYFSPHWQKKRAQVGAYEKSSLYGLIVNPKKRVNYGPINPAEAREIFIRQALVEGHYETKAAFYHHNQKQVDEVFKLEEKSRRRDILVEPEDLFHFYNERVPAGIYTGPAFEQWRQTFEAEQPRGLFFTQKALMLREADEVNKDAYPDEMEFASITLPLNYCFKPGANEDGVTLTVPITLLNRVSERRCEWLVPGLLEEKIIALIKALPKSLRRHFVPVPDVARTCFQQLEPADTHFLSQLSEVLQRIAGVAVSVSEWNPQALPPHLKMRFRLTDAQGHTLATGRDLKTIKDQYLDQVEAHLSATPANALEQEDITDWNFGDLPVVVELENAGVKMQGYPALNAEKGRIALRVFATESNARQAMRTGLRELIKKTCQKEVKYLRRNMPGMDRMGLRFAPFGSVDILRDDLINAAIDQTFIDPFDMPRTRESFYGIVQAQLPALTLTVNRLCDTTDTILETHRRLSQRISGNLPLSWIEAVSDIKDQINYLIYPNVATKTPANWYSRIPLYLKAIDMRLDALDKAPDRDRQRRAELLPLWDACKCLLAKENPPDGAHDLHWMIEELRISVFAQSIGTAIKVSHKRVEKKIQDLTKT